MKQASPSRIIFSALALMPLALGLALNFWPEQKPLLAQPWTTGLSVLFVPVALWAIWGSSCGVQRITLSLLGLLLPMLLWRILPLTGIRLLHYAELVYTWLFLVVALPMVWVPRGPMKTYITRRLLLLLPTFVGISLVTFLVVQTAPGSPVYLQLQRAQALSGTGTLSPEIIEATKKIYGLDKPLPVRYVIWLGKLARLDFGDSYKDHRPVIEKVFEAVPITLQLNAISLFLIYVISIPLGVFSATNQNTWKDNAITLFLFILYSLPSFWVAMLLMYFFCGGAHFNWFPVFGLSSIGAQNMGWGAWMIDRAWHLILPVFCLSYAGFAYMSRYARAGVIESIRQDYIRTARAYGFSERTVIYRYALRNSLIPIVTLLGSLLPELIAGSVIIEYIFSVPGMGRLSFEAILSRDYPLVMGILSITALLTLIGLIVSDTLYALVDPRIKFE